MKNILKWIRSRDGINQLIRFILKKSIKYNTAFLKKVILYWPVAGHFKFSFQNKTILLYSNSDDALASKLYYLQNWEAEELFWFSKFSIYSNTIFDLGANIGLYSLIAAKMNQDAQIYSFEPNPVNFLRLQKNIEINERISQIMPQQVAVGNKGEKLAFFLPKGDFISDVSSVYAAHTKSFSDLTQDNIEVEQISLDQFCAKNKLVPDIIKIDVELYEKEVLEGMDWLLTSKRPIIICEIFYDVVKRKLNRSLDSELAENYTLDIEGILRSKAYYFYLITEKGILQVDNLRSSIASNMYLLLPMKLRQSFYLEEEYKLVLDQIMLNG